jgi:hypothetical protein
MPHKCPIARAEYQRLRYQKNKEKKKEYYEENKEKILTQKKLYYEEEENKERAKRWQREYTKSPQGIKAYRLSDWRKSGLIHDDIDELYERYIEATHCEECEEEFVNDRGAKQRCMDHCHESGLFRNFLCKNCNFKRR